VYPYFRYQGLTSLTSGCGVRGLQASTPVPALFTVCGGFRGKGFRGVCLRLFTHQPLDRNRDHMPIPKGVCLQAVFVHGRGLFTGRVIKIGVIQFISTVDWKMASNMLTQPSNRKPSGREISGGIISQTPFFPLPLTFRHSAHFYQYDPRVIKKCI
jgi:hypothetical protein